MIAKASETAPRVIRDKDFAIRIEKACENHAHAPSGHGRQKWLRDELEQAGAGAIENLFLVELDAHRHLTIVDQSGLTTSSASSGNARPDATMRCFSD